jgi:hypothetical protein
MFSDMRCEEKGDKAFPNICTLTDYKIYLYIEKFKKIQLYVKKKTIL